MTKYVLNEVGEPVPCEDVLQWAQWFEKADRCVDSDQVSKIEDVVVSTVFLGLDCDFSGKGPPLLWETRVFGGKHDQEQERYTIRADAETGHQRWVELVRASVSKRIASEVVRRILIQEPIVGKGEEFNIDFVTTETAIVESMKWMNWRD